MLSRSGQEAVVDRARRGIMELKANSFRTVSFRSISFRTIVHRTLLTFALLTAAVPAWCAREAPAAEAPKTVNINTADAATLAEVLTGVGLAKAEAIIAYRKEHGGFKSVEQLSEVKGIGEKLVKANQERIVVK
jgi:competence protein ComEA